MAATVIQKKRLRTLIIARLFFGAFLMFCAQFVFPLEGTVFYAIIAAISLLSIIYVVWLYRGKRLRLLAYLQTGFDLFLESVLIYYTGGVDSLFAGTYVLTILSVGLALSPLASFIVATGGSLCFIGTASLTYLNWIPPVPFPTPLFHAKREIIYLFYAGYVQITVFFLVAVLTYYFSGMIRKLEDKVKTQERLALLGEVASNIAHEIRNPLASISGSIELIADQLNSHVNEKQQKLLNAIVDESTRIKRIFSGILDYARVPELHYEEITVEPFLDQVLLLTHYHDTFSPKTEIKTLYRGKPIKLYADPECLKQVFMNIIMNAFEAMPNGGVLTIDCNENRHGIIFLVEDTGSGMSQETIKSLFVPFKTTKTNGTGLGMAQAYKIVHQHGGKISVRSKQGLGSTVELLFPTVE